jgi:hypothetical protein
MPSGTFTNIASYDANGYQINSYPNSIKVAATTPATISSKTLTMSNYLMGGISIYSL